MSFTGLAAHSAPMDSTRQAKAGPRETGGLHTPVMLSQVLEYLRPRTRGVYIDATLGLGGHARAILEESAPEGKLLGIDRDRESLERAARGLARYAGRFELHHGNFAQVKDIAGLRQFESCDGILADLGLSSFQLETAERGFSFQRSGPLDMRMEHCHPVDGCRGGEPLSGSKAGGADLQLWRRAEFPPDRPGYRASQAPARYAEPGRGGFSGGALRQAGENSSGHAHLSGTQNFCQ